MVDLTQKVIIITGASAGIGQALALALAPYHVRMILSARRVERLETLAAQCRQMGSEVIVQACDVAQRAQVEALVTTAVSTWQRLDIMVANAGFGFLSAVHETTEAQFDEIVDVNVKGTWYAMAAATPVMIKQRSGHIIATSSAAARRGLPFFGPYAMTKAAQLSLCEAARVELKQYGIKVSSVHPITTETDFFTVASDRSQMKTSGLGSAQTAATVARKMVHLMQHPKPELWPHWASRYALVMAALWPRLGDYIMGRSLKRRGL